MTSKGTSHRKKKDGKGFCAKARVVEALLENPKLTLDQAYHQACLVDDVLMPEESSVERSVVAYWLRNTRSLWDAGLERGDGITVRKDITIPKEVLPLWRNARRLAKGK